MRRRPHRAEIRADVYGVRDEDECEQAIQNFLVVIFLDDRRNAFARHRADARACLLYRHHEGEQKERGPQLPVAELRAGLGVGGDTGRIIIRRAGDQPRPDDLEEILCLFTEFSHR